MKTPFKMASSMEEPSTESANKFPYGSRFLKTMITQFATLAIIVMTLVHYIKNLEFYSIQNATILLGFYAVSITALWRIAYYISHKEWDKIFPPYVFFFCAMFFKFLIFLNPPSKVELVYGLKGIEYFAFHDVMALLFVTMWTGIPILVRTMWCKLDSRAC
jgi:hypothetical protein